MLIDYLQESSEELRRKREEYRSLFREYKRYYSRDIRDELNAKKEEIRKMRTEISEHMYENLQELVLIKRYFPDLYAMLLEDESIGGLIRKKDWLISRKEEKKEQADGRLRALKAGRSQLREAKKFIEKWPRPAIDAKSVIATWPVLKGVIEGEPDKLDALAAMEKKRKELVREGWSVLLNQSMIGDRLNAFVEKIKKFRVEESAKRIEAEKAKGRGSVPEYEAIKEFEKARKERERMERVCGHLLLANPMFLEKMRKELRTGKKNKTELERMIEKTVVKKINETTWLKEMKKRLEVD